MKFSLIIFLLPLLTSHAFTLNNSVSAAFATDTVTINVTEQACQEIGLSNNQLLELAYEATQQYWNKVSTSRLRFVKGSLKSVSSDFRTGPLCNSGTGNSCDVNTNIIVSDNILISCNTNASTFTGPNILAATLPNNISGTSINGALVLINDNANNIFQDRPNEEKKSILAHEIGHAIGLGHSNVTDSLMHSNSNPDRRRLGEDDVDGVTYLYPRKQPIAACGSIKLENTNNGQLSFIFTFLLGIILTLILKFKFFIKY